MVVAMGKSINYSINTIKFISTFAVIALHCIVINNMVEQYNITLALTRFAVPIFFLISGFYSYYKNNEKALQKYKTRIIRLLKLIITANLFYFIVTPKFHNLINLYQFFNIKTIAACLIFNLPLIAGHLWFLDALLYCYILVFVLSKFNLNLKKFYFIIPILLITNLILGEISSSIRIVIPYYYYRNFIFTGLPFFMIGYLIHDKEEFIKNKISNKLILLTLVPICCLTIIESIYATTDLYLGTILFSIMIFIWSILNQNSLNFKITNLIGGKLYGYIYILHLFVVFTLLKYFSINIGWLNPFLVFIVTTILSYIVYTSINKLNQIN